MYGLAGIVELLTKKRLIAIALLWQYHSKYLAWALVKLLVLDVIPTAVSQNP